MKPMALIELRTAYEVDAFIARNTVALLLVGSGRGQPADAVMASLCASVAHPQVARTEPDEGTADQHVRRLLEHYPHTDRACLALFQGSVLLDVLRSTDIEAHGARWAEAHFAERFLTRLAGT